MRVDASSGISRFTVSQNRSAAILLLPLPSRAHELTKLWFVNNITLPYTYWLNGKIRKQKRESLGEQTESAADIQDMIISGAPAGRHFTKADGSIFIRDGWNQPLLFFFNLNSQIV